MTINDSTPIAMLTAKQLKDYLFSEGGNVKPTSNEQSEQPREKHYLYGIKQLANFLNVCYVTAWKLKETTLRSAVYQQGRVIVIDADEVLKIMGNGNG